MINIGKAFGIVAALSLVAGVAHATTPPPSATVHLTFIGCETGGHCFAGVTPAISGSGCGDGSQIRFDTTSTNAGPKEMYQAALSAMLAGKSVFVQPSACLDGFIQPNFIWVNN